MVNLEAPAKAKAAHLRKRKKYLSKSDKYWLAHPGPEADVELARDVIEVQDARRDLTPKDELRLFCAKECGTAYNQITRDMFDFDIKVPAPKDTINDDGTPGGRSRLTPAVVRDSEAYAADLLAEPPTMFTREIFDAEQDRERDLRHLRDVAPVLIALGRCLAGVS